MKYILGTCFLAFSMYTSAQDYGTFVSFNIGRTQLDLTENFEGESDTIISPGAGLSVGYLFDSNIITQLGVSFSENSSLLGAFDRFSLVHLDVLAGYQLQQEKIRFTPKIGYASWALNAKEGQLFNSGSEDSKEQEGNDFFWAASLGYSFSDRFELSLSHKNVNTNFGGYNLSHIEFLLNIQLSFKYSQKNDVVPLNVGFMSIQIKKSGYMAAFFIA